MSAVGAPGPTGEGCMEALGPSRERVGWWWDVTATNCQSFSEKHQKRRIGRLESRPPLQSVNSPFIVSFRKPVFCFIKENSCSPAEEYFISSSSSFVYLGQTLNTPDLIPNYFWLFKKISNPLCYNYEVHGARAPGGKWRQSGITGL